MTIKKLLSPLLIATLALIGLLIYLNLPQQQQASDGGQGRNNATPVVVFTVKSIDFPVTVEGLGTAKANEAITLTSQQSDVIQQINFDDGDEVEKGQLLLSMNNREERARVNELDISLQEAKRQLKRVTNLARNSVASEQLLDEQQAKVKTLRAQLEVANARLEELELRAPFSGKLGIRQVSVGAYLTPSDVITTLDDLRKIKVDFSISESHLPSLSVGQIVTAGSVAYPGKTFNGAISSVDSRVDANTRSIKVRAIIDNPDRQLRPGMLLQITLQKQVVKSLVVPEKTIIPNEDKKFVFVIEDGKAVQKEVITGLRRPGIVQIVSGLQAGEQIVTEGALRLRNGSTVSILSKAQL
ncbi:efflux RND transporter periplasmic adaptor subunit [Aliiglaciecola sp. LCG003]|uniref:efflux RND transporter periplasmic adaptor subunit n=1 Tax=Aliiglaciecola sp. LCG003 TaxID=3053655 RepID=UPI002573FF9E|nr:efflux RND transporter periplasmic adaptor subunit [Aliiglaciecola sp. LCG003]WJG08788.1 efflux RND transporter periplasmic adaptor subunit [Aliiglaciecola sp. LCG003]